MTSPRERLLRHQGAQSLHDLHRALSRLTSVITVMNTGAHPDDEQSGMLATLRFGYGIHVVIACSTRGEGGQNTLGPERSRALGVLRTREMEEAAGILDADVVWLGFGPDDPVHDFGFSKNGADTLNRWGRERIVERLVRAYRAEKPDIVIPTFLDVPGQHGHHRAMTEAAEAAVILAADPTYRTDWLDPWRVEKYYLPAWSGGGGTYDDELPPPPATVHITAPGRDRLTGAHFDEIGEWSRAMHASQGMGRWNERFASEWPLHLKLGPPEPETDIRDRLPATLGDLASHFRPDAAEALRAAQDAIDTAIAAFPDRDRIIQALALAARGVEKAAIGAPDKHLHRLRRKGNEIDAALMLTAGVRAFAWAEPSRIAPGDSAVLTVEIAADRALEPVNAVPLPREGAVANQISQASPLQKFRLTAAPDAALSTPFEPAFRPLWSEAEASVRLQATLGGRVVQTTIPLDAPFSVGPAHVADLSPDAVILRRAAPPETIAVKVDADTAGLALDLPPGWLAENTGAGFTLTPPASLPTGRWRFPLIAHGRPVFRQTAISYPHIGTAYDTEPLTLDILALDLALPPDVRIGYVGGGNDRVGLWLRRMGLPVTDLDAAALSDDLSPYTSIVVGIFAFGLRPDLAAATEKLHRWVEDGGHLLTLYHRPTDGWDPQKTPPRPLTVGSPSLRWRVTDPAAVVTVLQPDHPLLSGPNPIGPADWDGWVKERGLYFASTWDAAYQSLLSLHDRDEAPLTGALLSGRIGRGRHTHTSLVLHTQLDNLVPGAFRLLANLVQPAA